MTMTFFGLTKTQMANGKCRCRLRRWPGSLMSRLATTHRQLQLSSSSCLRPSLARMAPCPNLCSFPVAAACPGCRALARRAARCRSEFQGRAGLEGREADGCKGCRMADGGVADRATIPHSLPMLAPTLPRCHAERHTRFPRMPEWGAGDAHFTCPTCPGPKPPAKIQEQR